MKYLIQGVKVILIFVVLTIAAVSIFFGHRDIPLNRLKEKYTNSESSFISVHGMDVHFRDEGNPTDTLPIVLLHGTASSLHTFDGWTNELKNSNRVVRLDLPAYGLTGPFPDRNYSIHHYTVFLTDFLTALNIKQCVLAGNSLGGEIAWNFALKHPELVNKLILIDAAGYPINSKSVPSAFKLAKTPAIKKALTFITPRFVVRSSVENVYFDKSKVTGSLVDRYFELSLRKGNRQAFIDRINMTKDNSIHQNIKYIQQPTLILWGAEDLLIPIENAYRFQRDLPNSTLVIVADTGHVPMEESPMKSLEHVAAFLKNSKKLKG